MTLGGPPEGGEGGEEPDERPAWIEKAAAYQAALEAVFAIAIATGAGWYWDRHFGHAPVGTIVGATIGFGAFVLRLIRLGAAMNAPHGGDASQRDSEPDPDRDRDREPNAPRSEGGGGPT